MLEIHDEVVTVKIKGVEYSLTAPTAGALEDLQVGMAEGASQIKTICAFIVSLGLPEQQARGLTPSQMQQLIEYLSGTKKN